MAAAAAAPPATTIGIKREPGSCDAEPQAKRPKVSEPAPAPAAVAATAEASAERKRVLLQQLEGIRPALPALKTYVKDKLDADNRTKALDRQVADLKTHLDDIRPALPTLKTYAKDKLYVDNRVAVLERQVVDLKTQLETVMKQLAKPAPAPAAAAASSATAPLCVSWQDVPALKDAVEKLAGGRGRDAISSALFKIKYVEVGDMATFYTNVDAATVMQVGFGTSKARVKIAIPRQNSWMTHEVYHVRVTRERINSSLANATELLAIKAVKPAVVPTAPVAAAAKASVGTLIELTRAGIKRFVTDKANADSPVLPFLQSAHRWLESPDKDAHHVDGWPLPNDEDGDGYCEMYQGGDGDDNVQALLTAVLRGSDISRDRTAGHIAYMALWPMYMESGTDRALSKRHDASVKALIQYCKKRGIVCDDE